MWLQFCSLNFFLTATVYRRLGVTSFGHQPNLPLINQRNAGSSCQPRKLKSLTNATGTFQNIDYSLGAFAGWSSSQQPVNFSRYSISLSQQPASFRPADGANGQTFQNIAVSVSARDGWDEMQRSTERFHFFSVVLRWLLTNSVMYTLSVPKRKKAILGMNLNKYLSRFNCILFE